MEHIGGVPVPQIKEDIVQNLVGEQIVDVPVLQIQKDVLQHVLERVQNRTQDQIMDFPVPQFMEAVLEVLPSTPRERVHNRAPELIVGFLVPQIKEDGLLLVPQERVHNRAAYTGKVFTVKLRHHRDDQACVDYVGFIKGLDKHNMPRLGDVMVPPPQITKGIAGHVEQVVSWFDRKSQCALDEPLCRFQTKRSGRSSRSKLRR